MIPNRILPVLVATLLFSATGCSGSKLRNLVSRSDYKTLEELEAQDALAETESKLNEGAAARNEDPLARLVSGSRELDEAEEPKKPGRFSISRLFGRDTDESDLGTDPFVEPPLSEKIATKPNPAANKTTSTTEPKPLSKQPATSDSVTSRKSVGTSTDEIFKKMAAAQPDLGENPFASVRQDDPSLAEQDSTANSTSESFTDFMARRAGKKSKQSKTGSDIADSNPSPMPETISDFDALIAAAPERTASKTPQSQFDSELFPELNEALQDQPSNTRQVTSKTDSRERLPFEVNMASESVPQNAFVNANADSFAAASQEHGFKPVTRQDPWAAFANQSGDISLAGGQNSNEPKSQEFAWATPQSPLSPPPVEISEDLAGDSSFRQVSSTTNSFPNEGSAFSSGDSALMIPVPSASTDQEFVPAGEPNSPSFDEDPFFNSTDQSDEMESVPDADKPATQTPGGLATITRWPTRTWFFVLGCFIVALLLFLPDRKNRVNS